MNRNLLSYVITWQVKTLNKKLVVYIVHINIVYIKHRLALPI